MSVTVWNVNTLENGPAARPEMNDIAAVDIRTALPLYFDPVRAPTA